MTKALTPKENSQNTKQNNTGLSICLSYVSQFGKINFQPNVTFSVILCKTVAVSGKL